LYFHCNEVLLFLNALGALVVNATHPKSFSVNKEGLERQTASVFKIRVITCSVLNWMKTAVRLIQKSLILKLVADAKSVAVVPL
jgi:hypothetical protein